MSFAGLLLVVGLLAQVDRPYTETLLGPFPAAVRDSAVVSPDGRRIAYVEKSAGRETVVVDGKPQTPCDRVMAIRFSPDGKWVSYAASEAGKWCAVVNARQQGTYDRVGPPVFSPDSRRLVYVAQLPDGNRAVVANNKPGKPYEQIFEGRIVFSPDGARTAYGARTGDQWRLVLDGEETAGYEFLGSATGIHFSRDGRRVAFAALADKKWRAVIDAQQQKPYDNLGDLAFSPDGKHVAYSALQAGKWRIVVDGAEHKPYDALGEDTLRWNADSTRLAYAAQSGAKWLVVVGGKTARGLSPSSRSENAIAPVAKAQEGKPYDSVGQICFSPNGRSLAYTATSGGVQMVVQDGREHSPLDRVGDGTLVFSPDSRHLGYVARSRRGAFAVIDGKRKQRYDMVGYLGFTPEGNKHLYAATQGGKVFTVVDEKEAAHRYDAIWTVPEARLLFDGRRKFHYLAVKEGNVYSVEEDVE